MTPISPTTSISLVLAPMGFVVPEEGAISAGVPLAPSRSPDIDVFLQPDSLPFASLSNGRCLPSIQRPEWLKKIVAILEQREKTGEKRTILRCTTMSKLTSMTVDWAPHDRELLLCLETRQLPQQSDSHFLDSTWEKLVSRNDPGSFRWFLEKINRELGEPIQQTPFSRTVTWKRREEDETNPLRQFQLNYRFLNASQQIRLEVRIPGKTDVDEWINAFMKVHGQFLWQR